MALMFGAGHSATELKELWSKPPKQIHDLILGGHRDDLNMELMRLFRKRAMWQQLEEHCRAMIKETLESLRPVRSSESDLRELCAWRHEVWQSLLDAVAMIRSPAE